MKERSCCFTGQRSLPRAKIPVIKQRLELAIESLIRQGVVYYGCGGAAGFDTLAGFTVLELKEKYPAVKLNMFLPCKEQDIKWPDIDRRQYPELLAGADEIIYISETYARMCILDRNMCMLKQSSYCIIYSTNTFGGTLHMEKYAKKDGISVVNIADDLYHR